MTGSWAGHFFVLYEGILWASVWFVVLLQGFFGLLQRFWPAAEILAGRVKTFLL